MISKEQDSEGTKMLDTTDIPKEELEKAMREEAKKAYGDAFSQVFNRFSYYQQYVQLLSEKTNELISKGQYQTAMNELALLKASIVNYEEATGSLISIIFGRPRWLNEGDINRCL